MEGNNKDITFADKDKQTLSAYDIKGKESTLSTFKKKKNHGVVMSVSMNAVKNSLLQTSNPIAYHRKLPSVR